MSRAREAHDVDDVMMCKLRFSFKYFEHDANMWFNRESN